MLEPVQRSSGPPARGWRAAEAQQEVSDEDGSSNYRRAGG
jgi:hypothetical protein